MLECKRTSTWIVFSVAFALLEIIKGCTVDVHCRNPKLGELVDVRDGVLFEDKLFVLSSPQDVLTWCSSYITVFEVDNSSSSPTPYKVVELGGKIANKIAVVGDNILIPLLDKNAIQIISADDIRVPEPANTKNFQAILKNSSFGGQNQITLEDIEDIYYLDFSSRAILISSLINRKMIFTTDLEVFLRSKGKEGFVSFQHVSYDLREEFPIIVDLQDQSFVLGIDEDRKSLLLFPQTRLAIRQSVDIFDQSVTRDVVEEVGVISAVEGAIKNISSESVPQDISLFYPMAFRSGKIFIPAKLKHDGISVPGVIVVYADCVSDKLSNVSVNVTDMDISECSVFLESLTESVFEELEYFKVFFIPYHSRHPYTGADRFSKSLGHNLSFFAFLFREGKKTPQRAYVDLWIESNRMFLFLGRRYIESSPFYHVLGIHISDKEIQLSLMLFSKTILIDKKYFP